MLEQTVRVTVAAAVAAATSLYPKSLVSGCQLRQFDNIHTFAMM